MENTGISSFRVRNKTRLFATPASFQICTEDPIPQYG